MIIHDVLCNEIILIPFHPYDENSRRQQRVARLLFIFELILTRRRMLPTSIYRSQYSLYRTGYTV